MNLQSKLSHIEKDRVIVQSSIWDQEVCIGSSLGEGINAEEAEDRAIKRLLSRTNNININHLQPKR